MQNEPKFRKSQMNVSNLITADYEIMDTWWSGKNEPKTNPIYRDVAPGEAGTKPILCHLNWLSLDRFLR